MLPDIDGMEVCRTLRQRESSTPNSHHHADGPRRRNRSRRRLRTWRRRLRDEALQPARTGAAREIDFPAECTRIAATCCASGTIQIYPERRQCFVGNRAVVLTAKEFDLAAGTDAGPRQCSHARSADGQGLGISRRSHFANARHPRPPVARKAGRRRRCTSKPCEVSVTEWQIQAEDA